MNVETGSVLILNSFDLILALSLMVVLSVLILSFQLGSEQKILFFSLRMTAQLLFIGLILRYLFNSSSFILVFLLSIVMFFAAGREVWGRQRRKIKEVTGFIISTGSMFASSFSLAIIVLNVIIDVEPWYTPQYAIPLLGM